MLQEANSRAWSTEELTTSFGWKDNQGSQQQDIHELNRVLMDFVERALAGTVYDTLVQSLFFGM